SYNGLSVPLTLTPNQSSTFSVSFAPTVAGASSGTMSLTVSGSANIGIPVSGTGVTQADLTANPTSVTFTNIQVGTNSSQTETIKNTGGSDAHITAAGASGTGFSISGINPPVTLSAGQSLSFSITFTPPSAGSFSGSVTVTSDAQDPTLTIPVSGTAVGAQGTLSVSSPINVGNVVEGTSGTANGTLTASGATVIVSSVGLSGANPTEFAISGLTFPVTVNVGTPVSFTVTFSPTGTGSASASASFASNASNSPTSSTLTGTGTSQPVHTVQLTWVASGTEGITSYNVYRAVYGGSVCGSYSNIGSTSPSVTTFTDNNVTDGTTYCYATTAVDPSGESGYSNIAQAQIPAP
ncbi:MAG: choice-of-anchor D domain-containing protein, partial [Terriglobales bacterium]